MLNFSSKEEPKYKRVLLKVSGEALMGDRDFGHDFSTIERICSDIKSIHDEGKEVCLVVGGGNIYRGVLRLPLE